MISWFIKLIVQTFQPLIVIYRRVIFLCIIIGELHKFIDYCLILLDPWKNLLHSMENSLVAWSYLSSKINTFSFSGPIASLFTNRYGCRIVTIAGAILAAAGLAASALATNITYLYFTIGVCTGEMFLIFVLLLIFSVLQLKCEKIELKYVFLR